MKLTRCVLAAAGVLAFTAALTTASASATPNHHVVAASTTTTTHPKKTTTTTHPKKTTTTTHPKKTTTTTHAKKASNVIFTQSLTGTKHTKAFTAKSKWQLAYYYNCSGKKGKFTLYLRPKGKKSTKITSQTGLGGGGARAYAKGQYSLTATTKCKWTVTATKKK